MKYIQAKKLIKKDKLLSSWIKSNDTWVVAAINATIHTDELAPACLKICGYYIWWTWERCLKKSHKYGINSKYLKKYCWKTYEKNRWNENDG